MALTMLLTKPVEEVAPVVTAAVETDTDTLQGKVESLIAAQCLYETLEMDTITKQIAALKKDLQSIANDNGADDEKYVLTGSGGTVEYSARANSTEITEPIELLNFVMEKFGPEAVAQIISIKLGEVKKFMGEKELEKYTKTEKGSRTCKIRINKPQTKQ